MRLSTLDLTNILDAVNILNADHHPETLPRRTFDSVKRLIPTDVLSYEGFGLDNFYQGPLWFEPTTNVSEQMLAALEQNVFDHPIFLGADVHGMSSSVRVSDFVTLPKFRTTAIYNDFFKLLGTDRQLSASLHVTSELSISCSLCRVGTDYTDKDCAKLDLLTPHLTTAFRNARFTRRLEDRSNQIEDLLATVNIAIMSLTSTLTAERESLNARILIDKYFRPESVALPEELASFVTFHRARFEDDEFYLPPPPLERAGPDGNLVVRLSIQSNGEAMFLLLEEFPHRPLSRNVVFGLSPRETEVLSWIGRGKTDSEISLVLNISVRTVHKHVENIFNKLGVETRTAAVSFLHLPSDTR